MSESYERYVIEWHYLTVEVRYCRNWSDAASKAYGEPLAHLEFRTIDPEGDPMPISKTGYRSEFLLDRAVQERGGAEKFACAVLDDAARTKHWRDTEVQARQLPLF